MKKNKILYQGAEAKIYLTEQNQILKIRTPKSYRHPQLDKQIIKRRTKAETKILAKAKESRINVPKLLTNSKQNKSIYMEYIPGECLSQTLNSKTLKSQISIAEKIGTQVSKLHASNIIHSDLTTSNILYSNNKIYLIDFGLSYISYKIEDKAVDLHLLHQALEAKHHKNAKKLFAAFLQNYKDKDSKKIIKRLKIVEKRGRYKH